MNACNICQQRTRANLCARANDLGMGATWCADIPEGRPIDSTTVRHHAENLRHERMRSGEPRDTYLKNVASAEGRCVAFAVLAEVKETNRA